MIATVIKTKCRTDAQTDAQTGTYIDGQKVGADSVYIVHRIDIAIEA